MTEMTLDPTQDWEALFNMRGWLEEAVKAKGAKVTGAGCGGGSADLSITLEGFPYIIIIKPVDIRTNNTDK